MAIKSIRERLTDLTVEQISKFPHGGLDAHKTLFIFDNPNGVFDYSSVTHPVEVFDALAETWLPLVRKYLVNNPNLPQLTLQYIVDRATKTDDRSLTKNEVARIVQHPNVTLGMVEQLWTRKFNHHTIAMSLPATFTSSVFEKFFNEGNTSVMAGFAENSNTPTYLLDKLDYSMAQFRAKLAVNPHTSPEVLTKIWAKSKNSEISFGLLANPATPTKTLVSVWNQFVKSINKGFDVTRTVTHVLNFTHSHSLIVSKAKLLNNSLNKPFRNSAIQVASEDYVNVLKPYYPEATIGMPTEWLKGLLETVEENYYLTSVKELETYA